MIVQPKMGRTFSTILTSSSCWVVQFRDGWKAGFWTALFRNLRLWVGAVVVMISGSLFSFGAAVVEDGLVIAMFATAFVGGFVLLQRLNVAASNT